jgi:hypothetical protein
MQHWCDRTGTYFPGVRASAGRTGETDDPLATIQNIARARVTVRGTTDER